MNNLKKLLLLLPPLGFFFWSYILTDRMLTLTSLGPYQKFQQFLWQWADNHTLQTVIYLVLIFTFFIAYFVVLKTLGKTKQKRFGINILILVAIPLLFALSLNALSYDLYNYMFDAKLVLQYHLDPHATAAITFLKTDAWVPFMRNISFPTTYGYAWTALSLVPFFLGFGKLLPVFIAFKLYALLALILLLWIQGRMLGRLGLNLKVMRVKLTLFFASPLVLIETLSSAHNDIWMILFAFASLYLLLPGNLIEGSVLRKTKFAVGMVIKNIFLSLVLLVVSTQIKFATILLVPVWLLFFVGLVGQWVKWPTQLERLYYFVSNWWGDLAAGLMFLPLFTELSRQFHPWYLLWSFSFLPFVKSKLLRVMLLTFSVTSLLRYAPVLYTGMYSGPIESMQRLITWTAVPIGIMIYLIVRLRLKKQK